jgi:hypothetical protein
LANKNVYISGPMTGIADFNYPAFEKAKSDLEDLGFIVKSPHEAPKCKDWIGYMRFDIKLLCDCDYIYMLSGWENSKGAKIEKQIAEWLELKFLYQ